jgi:hypothetical protein
VIYRSNEYILQKAHVFLLSSHSGPTPPIPSACTGVQLLQERSKTKGEERKVMRCRGLEARKTTAKKCWPLTIYILSADISNKTLSCVN